ncbi:MAG: GTP-binding protein [Treponema sp.]|jgi:G3E family GTPase|nr:GTP-binding protein [Treponema sp.]
MDKRIKLDIVSGFLGAGKTTLINKLLTEAFAGERIAVLENEFGEISIDGELLAGQDLKIKEISNGCICCTLQGDFVEGIKELTETYKPERIIIEPTGIGKTAEILGACKLCMEKAPVSVHTLITVVSAPLAIPLLMAGGDFYCGQIQGSPLIILSAVQKLGPGDPPLEETIAAIRDINHKALVISENWETLDSLALVTLAEESMARLSQADHECGHDHDHTHHHHDDDEDFDSFSFIQEHSYSTQKIEELFSHLEKGSFGLVFRAKGFILEEEQFFELNYVYGRIEKKPIKYPGPGKLVIIGKDLRKEDLARFARGPL